VAESASLTEPTLLTEEHNTQSFDSGEDALDHWLKTRALSNVKNKATRVYVTCAIETIDVVGYYGLSTGQLRHKDAIGRMRRNMPDPIPVILLGRLAVDKSWQGKNIGTDLLAHAVEKAVQASEIAGARLLVVHALNESAKAFYERFGFTPLPDQENTLAFDLKNLSAK